MSLECGLLDPVEGQVYNLVPFQFRPCPKFGQSKKPMGHFDGWMLTKMTTPHFLFDSRTATTISLLVAMAWWKMSGSL
jgi:hypothetical protein